jgi:hypothetical protein
VETGSKTVGTGGPCHWEQRQELDGNIAVGECQGNIRETSLRRSLGAPRECHWEHHGNVHENVHGNHNSTISLE